MRISCVARRGGLWLLACWLTLTPEATPAQSPPGPSSDPPPANSPQEVVISADRIGGVAPIAEIRPSEWESYGASTLADLIEKLNIRLRSGRSNKPAVILINGLLADETELGNLPPEATEQWVVYPEELALRYGFSADRLVLNIVLRPHFRGLAATLSGSSTTEGGGQTGDANVIPVRIDNGSRATLNVNYQDSAQILESEHGIESSDSEFRTLVPATRDAKLSGTFVRPIREVSSSLEASIARNSSKSMHGLAGIDSPFQQALTGTSTRDSTHVGGKLTGFAGKFNWLVSGVYDHSTTHSVSGVGIDATGALLLDRSSFTLDNGNFTGSLSGPVASLPAGAIRVNAQVSVQVQRFASRFALPNSTEEASDLTRTVRRVSFNTELPLTNEDFLPFAGEIAANLDASLDSVSDFGSLVGGALGLSWEPLEWVAFNARLADQETAPGIEQLRGPTTVTPNVKTYDYVTGQTVYVTQITGGDAALRYSDQRTTGFGLSLGKPGGKTRGTLRFERKRIGDAAGSLPPATSQVELAFPDRFVRDASGNLVEVDNRIVNFARETQDDLTGQLEWFGVPHFFMIVSDTWHLRDTIEIRPGLAPLDELNGSPAGVSGGKPRHEVRWDPSVNGNGWGAQLDLTWHGATDVVSGSATAPGLLHFSAQATANLFLFADLGSLSGTRQHLWTKGVNLNLAVINLFDTYQTVRDSTGATPLAFQPGYLDPRGRVVQLNVRKAF